MSQLLLGVMGRQGSSRAPGDLGTVGLDGRRRSIAELQLVWRELLAEQRQTPRPTPHRAPGIAPDIRGETTRSAVEAAIDDSAPASAAAPPSANGARQDCPGGDLPAAAVFVLGAHAGAGASTIALAIAAAAAEQRCPAHLVETAAPTRSGLAAAAESELGINASGDWRRGRRGRVTIDRRAADRTPHGWPAEPQPGGLTVADLGLPADGDLARLRAGGRRTVVVFRATVPGLRRAEQTLARLAGVDGHEVLAAAVGATRWPGQLTTAAGPRVAALRAAGRVVAVPVDRHLELTGPTHQPLPRAVRDAGRVLLLRLDQLTTPSHSGESPFGPHDHHDTRTARLGRKHS